MNASITLADLSVESAEIENDEGTSVAIIDETPNPVHAKEFDDMMLVFETYETIVKRKYVCRSDMENIKALTGTYPVLGKLIDRYPINSFTQEPSRTNYEVSTESFVKTAYEAVVEALGSVLAYVITAVTKLWNWLSQAGQATAAVDDLEQKLGQLQKYIIEVDKILSNNPAVMQMARRVRDGTISSEMRNINGKWNSFKDRQLQNPEKQLEEMVTLCGVIKLKLPPFAEAVDSFLTELSKAETEADVDVAIAKMELFDMTSGPLFMMARTYGYNAKAMNVNGKLTSFESIASYVKGAYRSQMNERTQIKEDDFKKLIIEYKPTKWAEEISGTISWARGRTDPVLAKVKGFNNKGLKPGLEQVYANKLVPFLKSLASVLTGFTSISQCMGFLTDTRNKVSYDLCKATLIVVKKIDSFSIENKAKLTIVENAAIAQHRKDVASVLKG